MTRDMFASLWLLLAACSSSGSPSDPVVAAAVEEILAGPDSFELLTLEPLPLMAGATTEGRVFHGYEVIDAAALDEDAQRTALIGLVKRGIQKSDGMVAACFNPRHGLHVTRGGQAADFVICYECLSLDVHGPRGQENHTTIEGVQPGVDRVFGTVGLRIQGR